jgi:DNA-binding protein H-NS
MKQSDLDSMSIDELWTLHERIAATLTAKINAEKKAMIDRLKQANISVHQLRTDPGVSLWFAG